MADAGDVVGEEAVDAPPVVAVVVASDPGEDFAEMLASLGNQDYENLSVLVIDAGSAEPIADRVAEVLPEAYLHRLTGDPGWSVAANQSIELVSGSPFLLFCHDDVVLDEQCVSTLMEELYRQNAGIAAPKLVDWDDPLKMLQLGMGSDRFGVLVEQVERGEFDQQQYDPVRDVFVAPGGVQLVRADLFAALGGFDPSITLMGEDLDLCWRAHALGARVLAVSEAAARHRESMGERLPLREQRKLVNRHRLRTVMVTASGRGKFTSVPFAMLLIVIESLFYLLSGRRGQARDHFSAIGWNLARFGEIRRRQRALNQIRQKSEREVRALQVRGSAALNSFSRGQFSSGQDRFSGFLGALRSSFQGEDSGSLRDATVLAMGVMVVLAFGSRHLLTRGLIPVGQVPIVPGGRELMEEFLGGWRTSGTGGPGNPPTAFLLLALGRMVMFWAPGLFDTLLVLGPYVLGVVGTFRMTRPLGSARSAAVAATFYAASPLIVSMFSAGRWESLLIYAAAPFLLGSLLRIDGVSPFGGRAGPPGVHVASRSLPVLLIRYGILVAVVAAFVPAVIVVAVVMAAIMALSTVMTGNGIRARELGLAAAVAVVAPVSLHLPWSYDLLRSFTWRWLIGPPSAEAGAASLAELVQFAPGAPSASFLGLGLGLAALVGLAIAPRPLLGFAFQGWLLALGMIGLVWMDARGWSPVDLPAAETLLAPAVAGLALAVTTGVRAIEADQSGSRPLQLRAGMGLTAVALVAASVGGLIMAFDGAWGTPTQNYATFTAFLSTDPDDEAPIEGEAQESRVLWIGDSSVVPVDVAVSGGGIEYAVTDGGSPEIWGRWSAGPVGRTDGIGDQLDLARSGQTVRLGRLLAPYGVSMVIVVDQLAPRPYEGPVVEPAPGIERALSQQLDLERVPGVPDLVVFRNHSSAGVAAPLSTPEAAQAVTPADQLAVDLSGVSGVPVERVGPGQWRLTAPEGTPVLFSVPNTALRLNGQAEQLISGFDGLTVVPSSVVGEIAVTYPVPLVRRLGLVAQLLVVAVGAILAQTRREVQL
jgi:GT2 family glycosyltransferase